MELVLIRNRKPTSYPVGTNCSFAQAQHRAREHGADMWILKDDRKSVIGSGKIDSAGIIHKVRE